MHLKDISETFAEDMADPEYVAGYLEAVLEEGDAETFLVALRNVAKATGATAQTGNPEFKTVQAALSALGLRFSVTRAEPDAALAA